MRVIRLTSTLLFLSSALARAQIEVPSVVSGVADSGVVSGDEAKALRLEDEVPSAGKSVKAGHLRNLKCISLYGRLSTGDFENYQNVQAQLAVAEFLLHNREHKKEAELEKLFNELAMGRKTYAALNQVETRLVDQAIEQSALVKRLQKQRFANEHDLSEEVRRDVDEKKLEEYITMQEGWLAKTLKFLHLKRNPKITFEDPDVYAAELAKVPVDKRMKELKRSFNKIPAITHAEFFELIKSFPEKDHLALVQLLKPKIATHLRALDPLELALRLAPMEYSARMELIRGYAFGFGIDSAIKFRKAYPDVRLDSVGVMMTPEPLANVFRRVAAEPPERHKALLYEFVTRDAVNAADWAEYLNLAKEFPPAAQAKIIEEKPLRVVAVKDLDQLMTEHPLFGEMLQKNREHLGFGTPQGGEQNPKDWVRLLKLDADEFDGVLYDYATTTNAADAMKLLSAMLPELESRKLQDHVKFMLKDIATIPSVKATDLIAEAQAASSNVARGEILVNHIKKHGRHISVDDALEIANASSDDAARNDVLSAYMGANKRLLTTHAVVLLLNKVPGPRIADRLMEAYVKASRSEFPVAEILEIAQAARSDAARDRMIADYVKFERKVLGSKDLRSLAEKIKDPAARAEVLSYAEGK
ncbi:MAG TPA: hypothetical protein VM901_08975 [Bdellovibrionota bacterium]|jgi:hypothetical protein|nr:hypothetical protein [Bdellovibrionota bacterium]